MKPIARYQAVELLVPAAAVATKFQFTDQPELRSDATKDIVVLGIKMFPLEEKPVDFNGNAVATMAQLQNAELTLYVDGEESIYRLPCTELINSQNFAATYFSQIFPDEFNNLMIDWTKSYISLDAPLSDNDAFAFLFGISYAKLPAGTMAQINAAKGNVSNYPGAIM